MNIYRTLPLLVLPLLLTACPQGMGPINMDKEKIFNSLPGPKIDGVEGTMLNNAQSMTERGEYNKATQLYRQLVQMKEENDEYVLALAQSLRREGELQKSETVYERLLKRSPDSLDAKEGLGLVKLSRGEFDKAGKILSQVQEKDPKRWQTLNGLAILFIERGQHPEALAYFKEAEKYSERNISILNNVGLAHAIDDNPAKALAALGKATELAQNGTDAKRRIELNLAMVLGIYGKTEQARKILEQYLPEAGVDNNLGLYAYLAKDDQLAKSYLNMALSRSPYHYERAWENLTTITQNSDGKNNSKKKKDKKRAVSKTIKVDD